MFRIVSLSFLITAVALNSASAQSKEDAPVFNVRLATFAAQFERTHQVAAKFLVFNETTIVLPQDLGFVGNNLTKQLVDSLLMYNSVPQSIATYSPPAPFRLSSAKTLGSAFQVAKQGLVRPHYYNWDLLHAQFPDAVGVLELASPAYSADGMVALLYFWTGCGDLCGSGYLYLLDKLSGSWKVVQTFSPWVS